MADPQQEEVAPLDLGAQAVTLVSAAVIAAGPGATDAAVELQMERIVSLASGRPYQRVARWSGAVHFPCVILGAEFEEKNTKRWLIQLATRPHPKWNKGGVEDIRTDRIDSGSPVADQIGRWAQGHIGSPAWATKVMEKEDDGTPHRVLVALKPSQSVAEGITVPAGTPSVQGNHGSAAPAGGTEPSRSSVPAPASPAPKPATMREEDRLAQAAADAVDHAIDTLAAKAPSSGNMGDGWSTPPTEEQKDKIKKLAGLIGYGRDETRAWITNLLSYDPGDKPLSGIRTTEDAEKVHQALTSEWNDAQVERNQTRARAS